MSAGYAQITHDSKGWNAGRIAGNNQHGYFIYGEPSKEALIKKMTDRGLKILEDCCCKECRPVKPVLDGFGVDHPNL